MTSDSSTSPPMPKPMTLRRAVLAVLVFAAAGVAVAVGAHAWAPVPMTLFEQKRSDMIDTGPYDALFWGSSWTDEGIDPIAFERVTGLRAYNMAVSGAPALEVDRAMRRILPELDPKPMYVVIELREWYWNAAPSRRTLRELSWHDPATAWRHLLGAEGIDAKIAVARLAAANLLNAGRFYSLNWREAPFFDVAEGCTQGQGSSAETCEALPLDVPRQLRIGMRDIERQAAFVRSLGITPIYYAPAHGMAYREVPAGTLGTGITIETAPELFAPEMRRDIQHLNVRGAAPYTTMLGKEFPTLRLAAR